MDGVNIGDFGGADDGRNVEIAVAEAGRADADGLVGKAHVQRVAVGLAVDGDGANAQFLAGADDPQGDFAAIRDEDFVKHAVGRWLRAVGGFAQTFSPQPELRFCENLANANGQ
jgi:hypothetical protein